MNIANGPVRPTPANLHPTLDYCIQMTLPNDREWIGAFFDALYQLTYWFAWQRDEAHTGKDIAATWLWVLSTLKTCKTLPPVEGCCGDGDSQLIRQNPDNPCLIESSMDGTHWCTLVDLTLCTAPTGQPGPPTDQPAPGGGQVCYHGNQQANNQWLAPTVVSSGDVLDFQNLQGSANDGLPLVWYCLDGGVFFGGLNVGGQATAPGDPAPTLYHMQLIAQVSGVWYDCLSPITIPGGVSNAQVLVQLNDDAIGDNSGQYAFDLCVTNNAALVWSHTFDFALSPGGWTNYLTDPDYPPDTGVWTPGVGWTDTAIMTGGGNHRRAILIKPPNMPFDYTSFAITYDYVHGEFVGAGDRQWETTDYQVLLASTDYTNKTDAYTGTFTASGSWQLFAACARANGHDPSPQGLFHITKIVIGGVGADPFAP